ncbi:MAG: amidase [Pseudomonadota bacterium]
MTEPLAPGSDLVDLAAAIRKKAISAREATAHHLARIRALNPTLNAVLEVDEPTALAQAEAADRALARSGPLGPLHGVPLAHKDIFDRAGRITACGARIRATHRPDRTATVLRRLDEAGALDLGRLHMTAFAIGPTGHNRDVGDCRNPWDPARMPGGSSSGSGAAVAAGLVAGSLGTDTGGSVRLPAAACGLTGVKPTQGLVSRHGVFPVSVSMDQAGPLTRSARDCARLLGVIAGPDPLDGDTAGVPAVDYEQALEGGVRGWRVAVPDSRFLDGVDPEVLVAFEADLAGLRDLGAEPVEVALDDLHEADRLSHLVMAVEASSVHARHLRADPEALSSQVRERIAPGFLVSGAAYAEALRRRGPLLRRFVARVFTRADFLALPVMGVPVPTLAETARDAGPGLIELIRSLIRFTRPLNALGVPAVTHTAGFDSRGLPIGVQYVGRPFAEARLLRATHAVQTLTGLHRRVPALATRSER